MGRPTGGDGEAVDLAAVEAWLDGAPRPTVATWCGLDGQALTRLCQRIGVPVGRTVDVRGMLLGLTQWVRRKQREDASGRASSVDDGGGTLVEKKLREEILSLRKRREYVDAKIRQLRREYVPIAEVESRLKALAAALLRAGEQLGQRHGRDAQETFNAALDGVVAAMAPKGRRASNASGKAPAKRRRSSKEDRRE